MDDLSLCLLALVILPFILFIIRIVLLSWRNIILARQLKHLSEQQEARQRTEINNISAEVDTSNVQLDSDSGPPPPKDLDQPPAYDDVVQSYIDAKQQLRMAEEGAVGGGLTTAVSTVTIETEVGNSATDLTVTTTTELSGPAPPTYESVDPNYNNSTSNNNHVV